MLGAPPSNSCLNYFFLTYEKEISKIFLLCHCQLQLWDVVWVSVTELFWSPGFKKYMLRLNRRAQGRVNCKNLHLL